jgi:hypothetical protein
MMNVNNYMYNKKWSDFVRNPKELTRAEVVRTARMFNWNRKMPKWTVLIEARELPARPLVLEAAGVPPNDPTNSHQAVAILERLGFETRYAGNTGRAAIRSQDRDLEGAEESNSIAETFAAISSAVPKGEWAKVPADLSRNVDRYLYGNDKEE